MYSGQCSASILINIYNKQFIQRVNFLDKLANLIDTKELMQTFSFKALSLVGDVFLLIFQTFIKVFSSKPFITQYSTGGSSGSCIEQA